MSEHDTGCRCHPCVTAAAMSIPNGRDDGESPEVRDMLNLLSDYSLAMAAWADARVAKKEKACRDAMRAADEKYYALREAIAGGNAAS